MLVFSSYSENTIKITKGSRCKPLNNKSEFTHFFMTSPCGEVMFFIEFPDKVGIAS